MRGAKWSRLGFLLVTLAVVAGMVYSFLPQTIFVETHEIARGGLRIVIEEDGKTRVREKYGISSPISGQLARVSLRAGDEVVAGSTVLTTLDPTPPTLLDARSRAEAEARLKGAEATRRRTEPLGKLATENVRIAAEEFQRAEHLFARKGVSHEERDRAEHRLLAAREEERAAQFAQQIAEYELELAQAALVHSRRPGGEETTKKADSPPAPAPATDSATPGVPDDWRISIRSPITGRVLRVLRESEATVAAGEPLIEVGDPTDLEVVVDVLSSDAVRIAPGDDAWLEGWGGDSPLRAHVRRVEPAGFTKISALGVEEQRVNVILDLDSPPAERPTLGDDFRVEARIVIDEAIEVVKVPVGAVFREGDAWRVFVVRAGRVESRTVRLGRRGRFEAEVIDGLSPGERVVVYPSDKVQVGVRVRTS